MTLLQQLEKLLHRDARVRGAAQSENFPQKHPKRPPVEERSGHRARPPCSPCCSPFPARQARTLNPAPAPNTSPYPQGTPGDHDLREQSEGAHTMFFSLRDGMPDSTAQETLSRHPWQLLISDSHVALVGVDPVKQGLGCHPLDRQSALQAARGHWWWPGAGGGTCRAGRGSPHHSGVEPRAEDGHRGRRQHLRWSSFYSSRCGGCHELGQSLRSSSRCPPSPARSWRPGLGVCTAEPRREDGWE